MEDDSLQKELEYQFEWFHRNPELSYEEYETTKRIKTLLQEHDIEVLDLPLKTGLVAVIRGGYPGKVIDPDWPEHVQRPAQSGSCQLHRRAAGADDGDDHPYRQQLWHRDCRRAAVLHCDQGYRR